MRRPRRQRESRFNKEKPKSDRTLLFLTLLLTALGIIAVADVSAPQAQAYFSDSFYFLKQQVVWGMVGLVSLVVASNINYRFWRKTAPVFFVGSLVLLVLVLIPGLGIKVLGARRWLDLGVFTLQPSEFVKLTLAFIIAWLADLEKPFWWYWIVLGLVGGLIMLQPDFGTTIVIFAIGLTQMFVAGVSLVSLVALVGATGALGTLLVFFSDYRRQRLLTFIKSTSEPLGSSYHIRQILIALGSGGLFGVGLGQSRQKHLFLPEAATDSVFAIIAEELGFLGASILVIIFTIFVYRIIRIARFSPDKFSAVLSVGIAAWIGGQMFLNLGSMVALIPLTGIPLPFFSYGGSSLTMVLFGVGILLNISKHAVSKEK